MHLDDEAAVKCAEKLKTSFGMKKFSISLNHISFQGAQALGESRSCDLQKSACVHSI